MFYSIVARKSDIVNPLMAGVDCLGIKDHMIIDRYIRVSLTLRKIHCAPCDCGNNYTIIIIIILGWALSFGGGSGVPDVWPH